MLPQLTARQKDIYDFLFKTIREKGYAPSIPEIGAKFKIASTNGVSDHLRALEKKGYIRRTEALIPQLPAPLALELFDTARMLLSCLFSASMRSLIATARLSWLTVKS